MNEDNGIQQRRSEIQDRVDASKHTSDVNTLIDIHLELRQMQFEIQEKESSARRRFLDSETSRKLLEDTTIEELVSGVNGITVNRAEPKARIIARPMRDVEKANESEYKEWEGLRYTLSQFCDALQQKIANLRKENEIESMRQH